MQTAVMVVAAELVIPQVQAPARKVAAAVLVLAMRGMVAPQTAQDPV